MTARRRMALRAMTVTVTLVVVVPGTVLAGWSLLPYPAQHSADPARHTSAVGSTPPLRLSAGPTPSQSPAHAESGHGVGTAPEPPSNQPTEAGSDRQAVLREGMTGPLVETLQQRLRELGYQARQVTGTFDAETTHAVRALQKVHGLTRDAVVDADVHAVLDHPVIPRPRGVRPGFRMEVDLTRQVAFAVRDGVVSRIYDVSTGAPQSPTPQGEFEVEYGIDGWRYAELGTLWRPVYFTHTGIAFHGNEPVLPHAASHGCVRMTDPSINELFYQLVPGTPVSVYAS